MSDDWGREESAVNKNEKRTTEGKKREKESKTQIKKQRLHIGKRTLKNCVFLFGQLKMCKAWEFK